MTTDNWTPPNKRGFQPRKKPQGKKAKIKVRRLKPPTKGKSDVS